MTTNNQSQPQERREAPEQKTLVSFRLDNWPIGDVLLKLADATDHLLRDHDCDMHGYEQVSLAAAAARIHADLLQQPTSSERCGNGDPYSTCPHCGVTETNETLLELRHRHCRARAVVSTRTVLCSLCGHRNTDREGTCKQQVSPPNLRSIRYCGCKCVFPATGAQPSGFTIEDTARVRAATGEEERWQPYVHETCPREVPIWLAFPSGNVSLHTLSTKSFFWYEDDPTHYMIAKIPTPPAPSTAGSLLRDPVVVTPPTKDELKSDIVVTRDGVPCLDQKAALEEFKERCRTFATSPEGQQSSYSCVHCLLNVGCGCPCHDKPSTTTTSDGVREAARALYDACLLRGDVVMGPGVVRGRLRYPEQVAAIISAHIPDAGEVERLRGDINAFWRALANSWEIEPRSYFETEAPKNGFGSPPAMAVHYMWKRDTNTVEARANAIREAVDEARKVIKGWHSDLHESWDERPDLSFEAADKTAGANDVIAALQSLLDKKEGEDARTDHA